MENNDLSVVTWAELLPMNDSITTAKEYIIERMKSIYEFNIVDNIVFFYLDQDTVMHIVTLHWKDEDSLVMDYHSPDDDDDGDQYFISDYETPDEMFQAMLEETRR